MDINHLLNKWILKLRSETSVLLAKQAFKPKNFTQERMEMTVILSYEAIESSSENCFFERDRRSEEMRMGREITSSRN
jgi:hypothetical protein